MSTINVVSKIDAITYAKIERAARNAGVTIEKYIGRLVEKKIKKVS